MNIQLLKNKLFPYIIRFTETGIQHIVTNGNMMAVVDIPCRHNRTIGRCIGVTDETYDVFKLMIGMPIKDDTIGGVPFTTTPSDKLPKDINSIINLERGIPSDMILDPKNLKLLLQIVGDVDEMKIEFTGKDMPVVVSDDNWSVYIMGMG